MQLSFIALLSLVAVAFASPVPELVDEIVARSPEPQIQAEAAAMTDQDGNVVAFNTTGVYQAAAAAGV